MEKRRKSKKNVEKTFRSILLRIKIRSQKKSKKTNGAWGRTKLQLEHMWIRSHKLGRPIKSMRECDSFKEWLNKIQNDEKNKKMKPKWAAY